MRTTLIAVLVWLAAAVQGMARSNYIERDDPENAFVQVGIGSPLESENVKAGHFWEIRAGKIKNFGNDVLGATSFGFSDYGTNEVVSAPDRLAPGDLSLRTFNFENNSSVKIAGGLSFGLGAGFGWTWVDHSPDNSVTLADLEPYGKDDKLISVSERVHDNFSAVFKTNLDYAVGDGIHVGFTARYMVLHTFRERDVRLYDEGSPAAYNDRYYTYHSNSPVEFDHWTMLGTVRFSF